MKMINTRIAEDVLSGSLIERHCAGSVISAEFHILGFSIVMSSILGFISTRLGLSPFYKHDPWKNINNMSTTLKHIYAIKSTMR